MVIGKQPWTTVVLNQRKEIAADGLLQRLSVNCDLSTPSRSRREKR
jgi:hypothetical protein